jgi:hypothetical protein
MFQVVYHKVTNTDVLDFALAFELHQSFPCVCSKVSVVLAGLGAFVGARPVD